MSRECISIESPRDLPLTTGSQWNPYLLYNPLCIAIGVYRDVKRRSQLLRIGSFHRPRDAVHVTIKMHREVPGESGSIESPKNLPCTTGSLWDMHLLHSALCIFIGGRPWWHPSWKFSEKTKDQAEDALSVLKKLFIIVLIMIACLVDGRQCRRIV